MTTMSSAIVCLPFRYEATSPQWANRPCVVEVRAVQCIQGSCLMGYDTIQNGIQVPKFRWKFLPSPSANSKEDFMIIVIMEDRNSSELQVTIRLSRRHYYFIIIYYLLAACSISIHQQYYMLDLVIYIYIYNVLIFTQKVNVPYVCLGCSHVIYTPSRRYNIPEEWNLLHNRPKNVANARNIFSCKLTILTIIFTLLLNFLSVTHLQAVKV